MTLFSARLAVAQSIHSVTQKPLKSQSIALNQYDFSFSGRLSQTLFYAQNPTPIRSELINRSSILTKGQLSLNNKYTLLTEIEYDIFHPADLEIPESQGTQQLRSEQLFIQVHTSEFDLKLGQQVISWGSSDALNPIDFFGTKNLKYWSGDEERKRRGLLSAQLIWTPQSFDSALSVASVISFQSPEIVPFKTISQMQIPPTIVDRGVLHPEKENSVKAHYAMKVNYAGNSWDTSLVAYSGQITTPEIQYVPTLAAPLSVAYVYQQINALGYDASMSEGSWVFRSEGSLKQMNLLLGDDHLLQRDHSEIIIGIERVFFEDYRIQIQGFQRSYFTDEKSFADVDSQLITVFETIDQTNKTLRQENESGSRALMARFTATLLDTHLESQYFVLQYLDSRSLLNRFHLQYNFDFGLQARFGFENFKGPTDSLFNKISNNSNYFSEINYLF